MDTGLLEVLATKQYLKYIFIVAPWNKRKAL